MFRNYLKVALRNISKQRLFSFINIVGLTIGITASIFVVLYINDELSYDMFHTDIERMYRINLEGRMTGQEIITNYSCPPIGATLVAEIPEIESYCRMQQGSNVVVQTETESFLEEDRVFYVDSNFFNFFDFKLLEGDPNTVLAEPNTVVLTKAMALKYFGNESAIGKQLRFFNDETVYKVTGIAAEPPANSHFHFTMVLSTLGVERFESQIWLNNGYQTYVKGVQPLDLKEVNEKIAGITKKYVGPQIEQYMGRTFDEFVAQGNAYGYYLKPMKDIHLRSETQDDLEPGGDMAYIYLFGAIGLFIILIACINFMNLSTAKSAGRAKEVGLRKTLGSIRKQLIGQFLVESLLFSIIAGIVALVVAMALLSPFNYFSGKAIELGSLLSWPMLLLLLILVVTVGFVAGSYPAFYLTAFKPSEVLKGKIKSGVKSGWLRGTLVVVQFAISIILIASTLVVYQQLRYTQNKNLGFDKENVLVVQNTGRLENNMTAFKTSLLQHPNIEAVSYTNNVIPGVNNTTVFRTPGSEVDHIMSTYLGDYDHIKALGLELVKGRNFNPQFPSDSLAVLVNEATVKEMNWQDPLGEKLWYFGDHEQILTVIGVLKDFNFESLHDQIRPLVLRHLNDANRLLIRYAPGTSPTDLIITAETEWKKLAPGQMFQYNFMDENFDALYRSEERLGQIFYLFTALAIVIASLGLFGLAAFIAEQRTKEVGIRKALGASEVSISALLSKEFVKYVGISLLIAIYPTWYLMSDWLESFAYRISLSPLIFVLSGFLALVVALLTVSYQAFKAARINPVESLKYE